MTDENTQDLGAGEALPADTAPAAKPAPKSDAEAAQAEAETPPAPTPDPAKEAAEREATAKKNRTKEYIARINGRNAELEREIAEIKARLPPPPPKPAPPKPEDFYANPVEYTNAVAKQAEQAAFERFQTEQQERATQQKQQETWTAYNQRLETFAADKPDFQEVVGSIRFPISADVQATIAAHESGPAIAYHLGLNENDAFLLASARPEMADYVLEQIASRLNAAPDPARLPAHSQTPPALAALAQPTKPISQAPPPAPRVGGRSPTEIPPEKMTDDQWYAQDVERRRQR